MFARESHIAVKIFFLALLSLFLMVVDSRMGLRAHLRNILSIPLTGIQYLVSWPIQSVYNSGVYLKSHQNLIHENQQLVSDQLLLKAKIQRLMAVESENEELRALLHASSDVQGRMLAAHILSVDTDPFIRQVTLNRGRSDGLFTGQTVLDAYGVLGQVIEVNTLTSRILLVDDPSSGVPVQTVRNGLRAIAVGDAGSNGLRLINVPQTADIVVGDILMTSGLGSHYLPGYPVGQVRSVTRNPGLQFATILVAPMAHLDRGRHVLLVWPGSHRSTNLPLTTSRSEPNIEPPTRPALAAELLHDLATVQTAGEAA